MSKFEMFFSCDNAAFDEDPRPEIARILREWADKIEAGEWVDKYRTIHDINGNDVGRVKLHSEGA